MNIGKDKIVIESCITYNICRVYRRKKAKSKYEIGTLYAGNTVEYSKNECGGGWFKVLTPLPGWIQYSELSPPELTAQELEKLEKQKQAKEEAIDLTAETTKSSKEVTPETKPEDAEKSEKVTVNKKGEEAAKNGKEAPKNGKEAAKKGK